MKKNFVRYALENQESFEKDPFSARDALLFSWISYLSFPKEKFPLSFENLTTEDIDIAVSSCVFNKKETKVLLEILKKNPRYKKIEILASQEVMSHSVESQFGAILLKLEDNTLLVSYRGTDDSYVGAKEDLNMAFLYPIPSQSIALTFLEKTRNYSQDASLILMGHSKGGNLAVYSAFTSNKELKDRIKKVYSFDGPGFHKDVFSTEEYKEVEDRIEKYLPQSSLVGMILEHQEDYTIIKSKSFSVLQHNPFKWIIKDKDFIYLKKKTPSSCYLDETLNTWIRNLSLEERERTVSLLYDLISIRGIYTYPQFFSKGIRNSMKVLKTYHHLPKEEKRFLRKTIFALIGQGFKNLPLLFGCKRKRKKA